MARIEILEKQKMLEAIDELLNTVDYRIQDLYREYRAVGKTEEQATDYRTGELLWEDEEHTIPRYKDKWDYVNLTEEEMSEDSKAKLQAYQKIQAALEKLI